MTIRKLFALFWLSLCMTSASAQNPFGQTLQINTYFRSVIGSPTWLLIIRDEDTGVVIPYMFDIKREDNFWIAFTYGHSYRVTASTVKWGPFAVIHNFCRLEDGILSRQSMIISLSGKLTPYRYSSFCKVIKFKSIEFPVATQN